MTETNNNWWEKIEKSDGIVQRSTKEQVALDFLNKNRSVLPLNYFQVLVDKTASILEKGDIEEHQIRLECIMELKKLQALVPKPERSITDKLMAFSTDVVAHAEKLKDKDTIIVFREGKNTAISVKEFEQELSIGGIEDINSRGFAEYLLYLYEQKMFNKEKLESVLGGGDKGKGKQKLQDLAILWGLEDPEKSSMTTTQNILNSTVVLKDMKALLVEELQEYLNGPKNEHIKKALSEKFPDTFDRKEFDAKTKDHVMDIKELTKYLKKFGVKNIKDIEVILRAHRKDIREEKRRIEIEEKLNKNLKIGIIKGINNDKELENRRKRIESLEKENSALKDPKVHSSMLDYLSGKISQKEFDTLLVRKQEEIAKNKKNSEEKTSQEKGTKKTPSKEILSQRNMPISKIQEGESHTYTLDRKSPHANIATVKKDGESYAVQIGEDSENTISLQTIKQVTAYMANLRFLEQIGLGYFIHHLPQNKLSTLLNTTSKDTINIKIQDKRFGDDEKKRILSSFGRVLDIEGSDKIVNFQDGKNKFRAFFIQQPIESVLRQKKIIQNESLQIGNLQSALKSGKSV